MNCAAPAVLPATWGKIANFGPAGGVYRSLAGLAVVVTDTGAGDHAGSPHAWRHISASRERCLPSYEDLVEVKEIFAGTEAKAIMVFPPRSKHVNIHSYCLHLFVCLDGDPLPEFSGMIGGERSL